MSIPPTASTLTEVTCGPATRSWALHASGLPFLLCSTGPLWAVHLLQPGAPGLPEARPGSGPVCSGLGETMGEDAGETGWLSREVLSGEPWLTRHDVERLVTSGPWERRRKAWGGVRLSKLVSLSLGPAGSSRTSRRARSRPSATRTG